MAQAQRWKPISLAAMVIIKKKMPMKFAEVQIKSNAYTVCGGFATKPIPLIVKEIHDVDSAQAAVIGVYAKVDKGEPWLFKTVAGPTSTRRDVFKLKGLNEIENRMRRAAAESDDSQDTPPANGRKYKYKRARDSITCIKMPERPSCMAGATVDVRVYSDGAKGLWIDINNLPWLINYLKEEREMSGCPAPPAPPTADAAGEGLPGVTIKWDYANSEYVAIISDELRSTRPHISQEVRTSPSSITTDKWDKVAASLGFDNSFETADADSKQSATRAYLILWLKDALR